MEAVIFTELQRIGKWEIMTKNLVAKKVFLKQK